MHLKVCSYFSEEIGWREDSQAYRKKDPASVTAFRIFIFSQLLTDLTVDLISAGQIEIRVLICQFIS